MFRRYEEKECGKKTTMISCCCLFLFMIIFIPLYIRGSRYDIETKCEVLSRDSKSCTYTSGSRRTRVTHRSTQYKHKYLIHEILEGTCDDKTFSEWESCQGSDKYSIGKKRTCYVNENCDNETFSSSESYLIGAWCMLAFACVSFVCYLIGMYIYYSES